MSHLSKGCKRGAKCKISKLSANHVIADQQQMDALKADIKPTSQAYKAKTSTIKHPEDVNHKLQTQPQAAIRQMCTLGGKSYIAKLLPASDATQCKPLPAQNCRTSLQHRTHYASQPSNPLGTVFASKDDRRWQVLRDDSKCADTAFLATLMGYAQGCIWGQPYGVIDRWDQRSSWPDWIIMNT